MRQQDPDPESGTDTDGEAPEEVTFSSAWEQASRRVREALETARRDKELLKEKRKRREKLFKEQKKRKQLPAEVLEELSAVPEANDQVPDTTSDITTVQEEEQEAEEVNDNMENIRTPRMKERYKAVRLKDQGGTDLQAERAKDFVNSRLYGLGSKRTSVNEYYSLANKRDANKKGALQFVNKSWGKEQKVKAGKFKKKWIRKHGMLPS